MHLHPSHRTLLAGSSSRVHPLVTSARLLMKRSEPAIGGVQTAAQPAGFDPTQPLTQGNQPLTTSQIAKITRKTEEEVRQCGGEEGPTEMGKGCMARPLVC